MHKGYKKSVMEDGFIEFAEGIGFTNSTEIDQEILYKYLKLYMDETKYNSLDAMSDDEHAQKEILEDSIKNQRKELQHT